MMDRVPRKGEIWTDSTIAWAEGELHIGDVRIILALGPYVSYIKDDNNMGVMTKEDFLHWFSPVHPECSVCRGHHPSDDRHPCE